MTTDDRFLALFQAAPTMLWSSDVRGLFDHFSGAWLAFAGRSLDDEVGLGWLRRIHPDDLEHFRRTYEMALADRAPFQLELRLLRHDDRYRRVSIDGAPFTSGGEFAGYSGSCRDITDERVQHEALRAQLDLYGENFPGAFFQAVTKRDGSHAVLFVGRQVSTLFGLDPAAITQDPSLVARVVHPDDRAPLEEQLATAARTRQAFACDFRACTSGDRTRWVRVEVQPRVPSHSDEVLDGDLLWTGVVLDVTDLKEAEEAVRESERSYRSILRTLLDGFWITDMCGRFLDVNDAYCELIGYRREELLHMSISDIEGLEQSEETRQHLEQVRRDGFDRFETKHRRTDGTLLDIEVSTVFQPERGGRCVVFLRDVTERKRIEREHNALLLREREARAQAEDANRAKDTFLATLSHELRTPLTTILSWAQMLRMGRVGPDRLERVGEVLERNARALARLVDDLLDVSRVARNKLQLDVQEVDPASPFLAAVDAVRPSAVARSLLIDLDITPGAGLIEGDPTRLQQVFWNLLSNAVKFTPEGGRVAATLEQVERDWAGRKGRFARFQVADTGKGIDPRFLSHLFEPFTQEDSSTTRAYGGLGLGLSIVKSLVELHHGRVQAFSEGEGEGARFVVWLPLLPELHDVRSQPIAASASEPAPVPLRGPAPPMTDSTTWAANQGPARPLDGVEILVVDDDPTTCEVLSTVLVAAGARVRTAPNAAAALERLRDMRPDVVISDLAMPDEDGFALVQHIRATDQAIGVRPLPAIALTAHAGPAVAARATDAGFQLHLSKPVDVDRLVGSVRHVIGR